MKKRWIFLALIASMIIASLWNSVPSISETAHLILDPSLGALLNWNVTFGMIVVVGLITLAITLIQKYTTDQNSLRQLRGEQKALQEEMKKNKDDPKKMMEIQQKSMEFMAKSMRESMNSFVYTAIPIILMFRWFNDYFTAPALEGFKFFGLVSWFWFYLIVSIIFSMIFRKAFDVV